jgi:tRNA pseudouridine32 synthase / 23S rRNA pseudouridine746 synthase
MKTRPPIPMRDGVSASRVALCHGPWPTVLAFLTERLPQVTGEEWRLRMLAGDVCDDAGQPLGADAAYPQGKGVQARCILYFRHVQDEAEPQQSEHILYEDETLLVADKPHFMAVTPAGPYVKHCLLSRLKRRTGCETLSPLHRIDRDTAGLVLFAKRSQDRHAYQALFREHRIHKIYHAIAPHPTSVDLPHVRRSHLVEDSAFFRMREIPDAPANSETRITLLQSRADLPWALYGLEPVSGKRHQLRVHMAALGLPIAGDAFYPELLRPANSLDDWNSPLQLLAQQLDFVDPITQIHHRLTSQRSLDLGRFGLA